MSGDDDNHPAGARPSLQAAGAAVPGTAGARSGAAGLNVLASIDAAGRPRRRSHARWPAWAAGAAIVLAGAASLAIFHTPSADGADAQSHASAPGDAAVRGSEAPAAAVAAVPTTAETAPAAMPTASAVASAPPAATAVIENVAPSAAAAVPAVRAVTGVPPAAHAAAHPTVAHATAAHATTAVHAERHEARVAPIAPLHKSASPPASKHAETVRTATVVAAPQKRPDAGSAVSPAAFGPRRDNDVDLLEAMIAHGARAGRAPATAHRAGDEAALAEQLDRCNAQGVADAAACRARACAGAGPAAAACAAQARMQ